MSNTQYRVNWTEQHWDKDEDGWHSWNENKTELIDGDETDAEIFAEELEENACFNIKIEAEINENED